MIAYIVRHEDSKGEHKTHHIFSSRELAESFIEQNPVASGERYRVVERRSADEAVRRLVKAGR